MASDRSSQRLGHRTGGLGVGFGALRRTVDGYNQGAQAGSDVNFGRCGNGCSRLCRRFMRCGWYHCATTPKVVRAGTAVLGCLTSTASLSQVCMQQANSARSGISLSDIDEFAEALIYGRLPVIPPQPACSQYELAVESTGGRTIVDVPTVGFEPTLAGS
jgi:hypothetical protein